MKSSKLIALSFIGYLLATPMASGMLVLCFGSDGHVALESANSVLCCREWESAHKGILDDLDATLEPSSGPCCDDVQLTIESATLTVPGQKVLPTATVCFSTAPHFEHRCGASAGTYPLSAESPVAESLRTVVLRA